MLTAGSPGPMVAPQGSAEASNSHPTIARASFLMGTCQQKPGAGVGPALVGSLGDPGAGLSPAVPLVKLPWAQFPYWNLKGRSASLLTYST